ncbi:MAG: VCBS repeat-containing protein, partial [Acidobacteriota bacterium]
PVRNHCGGSVLPTSFCRRRRPSQGSLMCFPCRRSPLANLPSVPSADRIEVRARIVDERGTPIEGATARWLEDATIEGGTSDVDGALVFARDRRSWSDAATLRIDDGRHAPGYLFWRDAPGGPVAEAGDQVLYDAPGNRTYDGVAIGDLNDDGLNDLALAPIGTSVHIFLQNQAGVLEFLGSFPFGPAGLHDSMEIRDFDGDGLNEIVGVSIQQLVVLTSPAHPGGPEVDQIINLGGGENFFFYKHHLYSQDINGDGLQDVAVANNELGVQVFLTDGVIFVDGFESGDTTSWSASLP